ncbi:rhodanese-like domain-containing protein [Delftia acidovorans]|uniref:Rhodanese-like domain-containing protein n=1 Tax=Delftia acidovorans TaxID=80866 RepID=A0AAJ2QX55_DELAC|nr:rhodanese-like domain-containing protein [Delftia acidovorans]MDX4953616.1 rhodanese-like domain-containing protein [Delftia acidovorans]
MNELPGSIDSIEPQQLRELVAQGNKVAIVDVRSAEEFAAGHVEGAIINIPVSKLAYNAHRIPKDAQVVTVCNLGGPRSCNAAAQLKDMGYENAAPLQGGVVGWDGD